MMNDKIYEFATQAGLITFESIHDSMAVTPSIESVAKARKFAELIVRECASFRTELSQFDGSTAYGHGYENGLKDLAETIKEHFGVEE